MSESLTIDSLLTILGACEETEDQALAKLGLLRGKIREQTGIRRLQLALVEDALKDIVTRTSRAKIAWAWVRAGYDSSIYPDIKTFEGCCSGLGLNADYIRSSLIAEERRWRRMRLNHAAMGDNVRRKRTGKLHIVPVSTQQRGAA